MNKTNEQRIKIQNEIISTHPTKIRNTNSPSVQNCVTVVGLRKMTSSAGEDKKEIETGRTKWQEDRTKRNGGETERNETKRRPRCGRPLVWLRFQVSQLLRCNLIQGSDGQG